MKEGRKRCCGFSLRLKFPFFQVGNREIVFVDAEEVLQGVAYGAIVAGPLRLDPATLFNNTQFLYKLPFGEECCQL